MLMGAEQAEEERRAAAAAAEEAARQEAEAAEGDPAVAQIGVCSTKPRVVPRSLMR